MEKLTIGEMTFDVVEVNADIKQPILLATVEQQETIFKMLTDTNESFNILDFKMIDEDKYACNGIRNYLINHEIPAEKVVYFGGFLRIVTSERIKKDKIVKVLNIPQGYVYFSMQNYNSFLIDVEGYENDIKEENIENL